MIVDFHTHDFPDRIAGAVLAKLENTLHTRPFTDGTRQGLLASMNEAGIGLSVILPIATSPHQFDSILRFAAETNELYQKAEGPRLLSFAGIHPDSPDYKKELSLIAREGFKGIKLHPNFQGVDFDDIRMLRIIDRASELGLIILTHAGFDPCSPNRQFCSPDMILRVLQKTRPEKLVLAHLGSNFNYQESCEKLCGGGFYLDTAYSVGSISEEMFAKIVRRHGADRILFATDSPWRVQKDCVERFLSFQSISETDKEKILSQNALSLLEMR